MCLSNYKIYETKRQFHVFELVKDIINDNHTHIICVGGDGSLNEVINAVLNKPDKDLIPTIGYIPFGSANDFSKTVNLEHLTPTLFIKLLHSHPTMIDLGLIHFTDLSGSKISRYFINVADVGIGGYVVEKLNRKNKKLLGATLSYFLSILDGFLTYKKQTIVYEADGKTKTEKSMAIVIANGKYFGDSLCIAPNAKINDGKLNMVVLGNITTFDYILNLSNLKNGRHIEHKEVSYTMIDRVVIKHLDTPLPIDCDGEFIGYTPAEFHSVPNYLPFLLP